MTKHAAKFTARPQSSRPGRWEMPVLAALLLVSLLVRIPYLFTERLWPDEALYAQIARDFLADPRTLLRVEAYGEHLPIVPILLSPGMWFAKGLVGLRAVTLLLNLLGILATYWLGERIAGRFTGLCAALLLAVNVKYLHHSHLILIDGPFAVAHIGLALALLNVRAEPGWDRRDLVVGLVATGLAAMKWYAALMIGPIVAIYYLAACQQLPLAQRLRKLLLPMLCLGLFAVPYFAWKLEYLQAQGGIVSYFQRPATYYLLTAPSFVGGWISLCVVLAGGLFLIREAPRVQALIAGIVVVELAVMSLAPEKDSRYLVSILPFLGVLYALAIGGTIQWMTGNHPPRAGAQAVAMGVLALQFIPFIRDRDQIPMTTTYTGFIEAGEAVRRLAEPDALILAGSPRAMRYAVGRDRAGSVQGLPPTLEGLRAIMERHRGRVIVETDRWEYTQPAWLFPWSSAKIDSLERTGFHKVAVVQRPVDGQVLPVVLVVSRD